MWSKDWADVAIVLCWVAIWAALVYFTPISGV